MSSVVISGDTSGAVTVTVPAVAGTNTVTIAAQTGTLNAAGPAFSAYVSATSSLPNATFTKITFNAEEFDTNNNFDSTTNYRFTPTVAGYYQINSVITQTSSSTTGLITMAIYKNGANFKQGIQIPISILGNIINVSALVYCNGSSDYIEIYAYQSTGSTITTYNGGASYNYFQGSLVRGA